MIKLKYFLLYICLEVVFCGRYTEIGEICTVNNITGTCKSLYHCSIAIRMVQNHLDPPICFYRGKEPIACCPLNNSGIFFAPRVLHSVFGTQQMVKTDHMTCMPDPFLCCKNPSKKPIDPEPPGCPMLPRPRLNTRFRHPAWEKCVSYQRYFNVCVAIDEGNTQFVRNDTARHLDDISTARIIGGTSAYLRQFPHMAVIGSADSENPNVDIKWIGGGSLISEKFVLTAAHVVENTGGVARYVLLGAVDKTNVKGGLLCNIILGYTFPGYNRLQESPKHHDIAVVELFERVQFNEFIRPACLPVPQREIGPSLTVAGWGKTDNLPNSTVLLYTQVTENSHKCKHTYKDKFISGDMICGRGTLMNPKSDACNGDSGGPLMATLQNIQRSYSIEGIVSSGQECGMGTGVYTNVSAYMDFIMEIVWKDEWKQYKANK